MPGPTPEDIASAVRLTFGSRSIGRPVYDAPIAPSLHISVAQLMGEPEDTFQPPTGFAFVARVRNGVTQYAISPSRNNFYAVHRRA